MPKLKKASRQATKGRPMSQDADQASYLLRFGPCQDPTRAAPVLNYASIARLVQKVGPVPDHEGPETAF